jgi:hypothetical protein
VRAVCATGEREGAAKEGYPKASSRSTPHVYYIHLWTHRNKGSSNTKDLSYILYIDGASCVIQVCVRVSDGWILRLRLLYTTSLYINVSAFDILLLLLLLFK